MKSFIKLIFTFVIMNSSINAQDWQDLSMPDDTTIFHKMCRVDNYYWAIDYGFGGVYHSKDGGENWELQYKTEGEYLEAIQFLDKDNGYLCGDYGIVMKTMDGGKNWKEIGPEYTLRVTKANPMEDEPNAIGRYYYQMYFKNKNEGLIWDFEVLPQQAGWKDYKNSFYKTKNGGDSWEKIEYKKEEYEKIITDFMAGTKLQYKTVMDLYYANNKIYRTGRRAEEGLKISNDDGQSWQTYPLPQFPDRRYILRSIHFINDYQGYLFGGNVEEYSQAYVFETLDGGQSWHFITTDLPHIHYSVQKGNELLLSGKENMLKKWVLTEKEPKSFIHKGNASKILIDGQIEDGEWIGANQTKIKPGVNLFMLQDEHFLYLSVQYDTALYANYYCDLYFYLGKDTLLNIHASQQLGERLLIGADWTDSEPPFNWGYISNWTANTVRFDRKKEMYIPYNALEFQIAKKKLPNGVLKIALQSRDMNWKKEIINVPEEGDFKSTKNWLIFYLE